MGEAAKMAALALRKLGLRHSRDFTLVKRSKSSSRCLKEHFTDPLVQRTQVEGWRTRGVFQLEEVDRRENLAQPAAICPDLGAASRVWSQ